MAIAMAMAMAKVLVEEMQLGMAGAEKVLVEEMQLGIAGVEKVLVKEQLQLGIARVEGRDLGCL